MVQLLHYPLTHHLGQLDNPQISFNIKQKQPKTLDEALSAILELDSCLLTPQVCSLTVSSNPSSDVSVVA